MAAVNNYLQTQGRPPAEDPRLRGRKPPEKKDPQQKPENSFELFMSK